MRPTTIIGYSIAEYLRQLGYHCESHRRRWYIQKEGTAVADIICTHSVMITNGFAKTVFIDYLEYDMFDQIRIALEACEQARIQWDATCVKVLPHIANCNNNT